MKMSLVISSRLLACFTTLVALLVGIGSGPDRAAATPDLAPPENASIHLQSRIESLVQAWFAVLEDPNVDATALSGLLAETPFELLLEGKSLYDRDALLSWVSHRRAIYPQMRYRVDPIQIHPDGKDRYRVHFEFDRHAVDDAGLPHVARREHTWIVQGNAGAKPVILSIEERPLLFFPGTGPQVVCY